MSLQYRAEDLEPYNNREFLCNAFQFKVEYIQAFLALPHEIKLRFFLFLEERKAFGKIDDMVGYQTVLQKIAAAAKILQGKPSENSTPISETMEDKVNKLVDYQFAKLHVSDKAGLKDGDLTFDLGEKDS